MHANEFNMSWCTLNLYPSCLGMADSTHFHLDTAVELYPAFNSVHSGFGKMYLIATVFTTIWDEDD